MKKKAVFILWIGFWVVFVFALFEGLIRIGLIPLAINAQSTAFFLDKETLYRIQPKSAEDINEYGYRVTSRAKENTSGKKQIILAGDSFAFGVNVPADETIAAYLEQDLGEEYSALNLGVVGYGPDQALLTYQRGLGIENPQLVVLTVFAANDFNDLYKNKIFTSPDGGLTLQKRNKNILTENLPAYRSIIPVAILTSRSNPPSWLENWVHAFFEDTYDEEMISDIHSTISQEKYALMRGVLREFRDQVNGAGADFVVIIIPAYEQYAAPEFFADLGIQSDQKFLLEETVSQICTTDDICCLDLYKEFNYMDTPLEMFDPTDHHLTSLGYKTAAQSVIDYIDEHDCK